LALIPGDPSGIGPELSARLLAEPGVGERAHVLLIGDRTVLELGMSQAGLAFELVPVDPRDGTWTERSDRGFCWLETETIDPAEIRVAEVSAACGRSVLATLDLALDLARDGVVDGVMFAPFNKAAMHAAGLGHDDELHYMAERMGVTGYISELNTLDGIWTSRVTSHIALRDVADAIDGETICEAVSLIDRTLRRSGLARPRISVAALNPHAGDSGNFGREEIDVIRPAVESMAARQIAVDGPWPSDTVFLKAKAREIDAVVTMYHDQGQIALKLMGFDRGVTVQGGMPFPVTTPAHGTAFDIAGQGRADLGATRAAFDIACDMVTNWTRPGPGHFEEPPAKG
jgi:4-hydroxythreonine-4-phosphate dehydrogenase